MTIAAGELDQRIQILAPLRARSKLGGESKAMAPLRKIWAKVNEGLGREFIAAGAVAEQKKVAFKTRFAADLYALGAQLQVDWAGNRFEIVNVTGTLRSGEMWLHGQSIGKAA